MLALTSNVGAYDFQTLEASIIKNYTNKFWKVSKTWKNSKNLMYVVGATKAEYLAEIRKIIPEHFLLVPGVGAQGGNLQDVCKYGMTPNVGLLVNSSRGIIYASNDKDFAQAAAIKAGLLQQDMAIELKTLT